jgi:AraC family ethanolamine operon transcriptional activator
MLESTRERIQRFELLAERLIQGEAGSSAASGDEAQVRDELFRGLEDLLVVADAAESTIPSTVARRRALNRGLDFIEGNLQNMVAISDICSYAAVSERTLEYAFREYCGVTPKAYLNARRLHAFRDALRSPGAASVSSIAGEFGYWHMGKLADDYRATFGELPSATLKRRSEVRKSDA